MPFVWARGDPALARLSNLAAGPPVFFNPKTKTKLGTMQEALINPANVIPKDHCWTSKSIHVHPSPSVWLAGVWNWEQVVYVRVSVSKSWLLTELQKTFSALSDWSVLPLTWPRQAGNIPHYLKNEYLEYFACCCSDGRLEDSVFQAPMLSCLFILKYPCHCIKG